MVSFADILILISILFVAAYFYLTRNFNYWKFRNVPYNKPLPLFGNLLDVVLGIEPMGKYLANLYNQFDGPYFGFFTIDQPFLVLRDPDIIKRVLIKNFDVFQNRFFVCDENIDPISSNSLFGIKTPNWKPLRSKLSPVFTSGKIKMMLPLIIDCGENLQNYISKNLVKNVEAKEIAAKYTTDVIATCAFGIAANSFVNENSEFRRAGRQIFNRTFMGNMQALAYFVAPLIVKIFKFRFIPKEAVDFLSGAFLATIKQRENEKNKRNDLIDILIEMKNKERSDDEFKFSGDKLVAQAIAFFGSGHETTSSTIAFTLHELCMHMDIQDRLRKEILEMIQKHEGLTYEAIQEMKYLDMVVSETLRKYPLPSFLHRECSEEYTLPETGLVIEKGTPVMIPQYGLHWDPQYFPNPEIYDPERFSDENKSKIIPYTYLPFGDGPRNCIGERFGLISVKLGLIEIIKSFKVRRNYCTRDPLIFKPSGLLQAKDGIPVTFVKL